VLSFWNARMCVSDFLVASDISGRNGRKSVEFDVDGCDIYGWRLGERRYLVWR